MKKHIILSPHFDDAVLSLGGLITLYPSEVVVITVFGGTPSEKMVTRWDTLCGFTDSNEALTARIIENTKALTLLGVTEKDIINWDYLDGQYRESDNGLQDKIKLDILKLLESYKGNEISIYTPLFTKHPDHSLVQKSLLSVFKDFEINNVNFFLYMDLPYADDFARENNADINSYAEKISSPVIAQVIPLLEINMAKKLEALKEYISQNDHLGYEEFTIFDTIKNFGHSQAVQFSVNTPYVEVTYQLK